MTDIITANEAHVLNQTQDMGSNNSSNASPMEQGNTAAQNATTATLSRSPQRLFEDLEYLQTRCSICFDSRFDFFFTNCRDQFCRSCFNHFVSELAKSCWGISTVTIRCPVCSETLKQEEWSRYVEPDVVERYCQNTRPFKPLLRACPSCNLPHEAVRSFRGSVLEREQLFEKITESWSLLLGPSDPYLQEFREIYRHYLYGDGLSTGPSGMDRSISAIYRSVLSKLAVFMESELLMKASHVSRLKRRRVRDSTDNQGKEEFYQEIHLSLISSSIISLEENPDTWKELQFLHVQHFPQVLCESCQGKFCFRCGEGSWHEGKQCMEYMADVVKAFKSKAKFGSSLELMFPMDPEQKEVNSMGCLSSQSNKGEDPAEGPISLFVDDKKLVITKEIAANMEWKLQNGKACPRCSTIIHREEGCNKVDCTLCGYRFCWVCSSSWGENCGFYRCKMDADKRKGSITQDSLLETSPLTISTQNSVEEPRSSLTSSSPPELGVPDVLSIHSRNSPAVSPQ